MLPTAREAPGACSSSFIDGLSQTPLPCCSTHSITWARKRRRRSARMTSAPPTPGLGSSGFSRGRERHELQCWGMGILALLCDACQHRGGSPFAAQDIEAGDVFSKSDSSFCLLGLPSRCHAFRVWHLFMTSQTSLLHVILQLDACAFQVLIIQRARLLRGK